MDREMKTSVSGLKKILDSLVKAATIFNKVSMNDYGAFHVGSYFDALSGETIPGIQIYSGTRWASQMLGLEYRVRDRGTDGEYPYEGSFVYKGYKFYELLNADKIAEEEDFIMKEEAK